MTAKTFPAFPATGRRTFATTWWGRAWVTALEQTSLDAGRLKKGRSYARGGAVGAVTVAPGRVTASVQGSDRMPYPVQVLVPRLPDADWDTFLRMVASRAGHLAALLDRDMPPELVEDAEAAGVDLLPAAGDLEPECGCDDWGFPCVHAAALCYQVARLLDQDPFVLLLMRGRGERELLDELRLRTAPAAPEPHAGVPAAEVYAAAPPPLPEPPPPVDRPGPGPVLAGLCEPAEARALEFLAADAASRARRLLAEALSPGHADAPIEPPLTPWQDAVRLAAAHPDPELRARLCDDPGRLDRAVLAWEYGGPSGLETLEEPWTPDRRALARARAAIDSAWDPGERPAFQVTRNRWTASGVQLRYGRDDRWHPYRQSSGQWTPAGPPSPDPATALAPLLG
ncbi:SWIM zinc finger family protein [Bailinhaonella thermotolerans]|uniref:SWF or SNF family helicase n=1 Tax=Bailinhaonella thermotolerans TaxID=1070861 RepID=A0A3A4AXR0_9ACTN|nr:SWIM zinc finger family protein [Bailinhaonella thermotolerans]RJL33199.1 SWF or SNF family helicase [Bailinhaonella thermotolerans]